MKNSFSFQRYALLLKHDLCSNWRKYALYMAIIYGATLILFLFMAKLQGSIANIDEPVLQAGSCAVFLALGIFLFDFFLALMASQTSKHTMRKTAQIAYQTLPASNAERFAARITVSIPLYCIAFFVVATLGNFTQWCFTQEWCSISTMIESTAAFMPQYNSTLLLLSFVTSTAVVHALFTFGSTFFRNHPFLITILCYVIYSGIMSKFVLLMYPGEQSVIMIGMLVNACVALVLWIWSYIRFARRQL